MHVFHRVNAAQRLQLGGNHALHADGEAGDAGVAEAAHGLRPLQRFGIALERDFDVVGHAEEAGYGVEDSAHVVGRHEARRAAAEIDGGYGVASSRFESAGPPADFSEQGGDVGGRNRRSADGRRMEGAVQAAAAAEGKMNVNQHGISGWRGRRFVPGGNKARFSYFQNGGLTSGRSVRSVPCSWQGESVRVYSALKDNLKETYTHGYTLSGRRSR